jgi:hypothetical protein
MVNEVFYDEGYIQDVDPNQSQHAYDNNNQDIDINADLEEVVELPSATRRAENQPRQSSSPHLLLLFQLDLPPKEPFYRPYIHFSSSFYPLKDVEKSSGAAGSPLFLFPLSGPKTGVANSSRKKHSLSDAMSLLLDIKGEQTSQAWHLPSSNF